MKFHYSGSGFFRLVTRSTAPEDFTWASVMMTFFDMYNNLKYQNQRIAKVATIRAEGNMGSTGVKSHFLDSGAFSMVGKSLEYAKEPGKTQWDFFDTPEFWAYMEAYVAFVKEHQIAIDHHANVDVIGNPELTYRNQKWLEEKGLAPVPVVHCGSDMKWLRQYVEEGYDFIGLGGLVGQAKTESGRRWMDRCFDVICDNPERLPCVKLHGFGVTSHWALIRYPWWSVDSVSWAKMGGFGNILVPYKRQGEFSMAKAPRIVSISADAPARENSYFMMNRAERAIVDEWLAIIDVPFGSMKDGEMNEPGVCSHHTERRLANLRYFELLIQWLPEWPWAFKGANRRVGFGLI